MFGLRNFEKFWLLLAFAALNSMLLVPAVSAQCSSVGAERAAWLLERGQLESLVLTGERFAPDEFGGGAAGTDFEANQRSGTGRGPSVGLAILASTVLPGAGEALMGYKRGYIMMALDIFSWTQVAKYHQDGKDYSAEYYAYADLHYSDENLLIAYNADHPDFNDERFGEGERYFHIGNITNLEGLGELPLYVSVEDDRREYYENLGKWDQFVFGWDDYLNPTFHGPEYGYEATQTISDFRQPWVSEHREVYRMIRDQANDAYKTRDRFMYFNMGLRVFSVMQVAYLNGLLGGGPDSEMKVAGHSVEFIAEPTGISRGTVGARVSF